MKLKLDIFYHTVEAIQADFEENLPISKFYLSRGPTRETITDEIVK